MQIRKQLLLNFAIAFFISTALLLFSQKGVLKRFELNVLDSFFRLRGPLPYNPHIIIIEIDDENITNVGRWPWDRSWHAALIQTLHAFGAYSIYFDILFSEPSSEHEDDLFTQALKRAGNVYLPFAFQGKSTNPDTAVLPLSKFSQHIRGTGSINIYPDPDGLARRLPLFFKDANEVYPHIALRMVMDYLHLEVKKIRPDALILSSDGQVEKRIPLTEKNKLLINWERRWRESFRHYSFLDVLTAYKDYKDGELPHVDVSHFKNSICLVGVTAIGLYDIKAVPIEPEYPAVGILATAMSNMLDARFIWPAPRWAIWLLTYLLAFLTCFSSGGERPLRDSLRMVLYAAFFALASFFLFTKGIWVDCSIPLLALIGSQASITLYGSLRISMGKQRFFQLAITDELTHVYNIRYFKMILHAECLMAGTEVEKKLCVVMTDIDNFKSFNDARGHPEGDKLLKAVAEILRTSVRSSDVVARYGGDEMLLLLRGATLKQSLDIGEKLQKNVSGNLSQAGYREFQITLSVGVSSFREGDNEDTLIRRADRALYQAKQAGKNMVCTIEENIS